MTRDEAKRHLEAAKLMLLRPDGQPVSDLYDAICVALDALNVKPPEAWEQRVFEYPVRDLILFAELCKRNDIQEADLKQAAWNLELAVRAVMNERAEIVKNTMDEITMEKKTNVWFHQ